MTSIFFVVIINISLCIYIQRKADGFIMTHEGNKIIAVDFDGTLCEDAWPNIGPTKDDVINKLLAEQQNGAKVILWTCREGQMLTDAIKWSYDKGIVFDSINESLPEEIGRWGNRPRKVGADEYWDDKAVNINYQPEISTYQDNPTAGCIYRHFKGNLYKIDGVYKHTETADTLVAYSDLAGEKHWVRPLPMFFDMVDHNGCKVPRFAKMEDKT